MTLAALAEQLLREARRQISAAAEEAFHEYAQRLEADLVRCAADLEIEPPRMRPSAPARWLH